MRLITAKWATLGIFPRDCLLSSESGLSVESACTGRGMSKEDCNAVGCCEWKGSTKSCTIKGGMNPSALCVGEGVVKVPKAGGGGLQYVGGDADEWLVDHFPRVLYDWSCDQVPAVTTIDANGTCTDLPGFVDRDGHGCSNYTRAWCQGLRGASPASFHPPSEFADNNGTDGSSACCICGNVMIERRGARREWGDMPDAIVDAAVGLGYDQLLWDSDEAHLRDNFISDIRLVVGVDNYLEFKDIGFSLVQMTCTIIMVWTAIAEIQNFMLAIILIWHHLDTEHRAQCLKFALIAVLSFLIYCLVPICVVFASWIVIVESGSILGAVVDTVALLFLLDINNILLIHKAGGTTTLITTPSCAKQVAWSRTQFHR